MLPGQTMPGGRRKRRGAMDGSECAGGADRDGADLGMRVRIRDRKGKGKIVIEYATVDDYERVLDAAGEEVS